MTGFSMPSADKWINRFFRRVDNVVWDLMTGKLGVKTNDGIATIEGEGDEAQISLNIMDDFGLAIPAFAQSTPVDAVKVGDLIYTSGDTPGWIVKKNDKSFRLMRPAGTTSTWTPPKVQMLGLDSGVMVVRSLTTMLPGGAGGLGVMQGMLLPMLQMQAMTGDNSGMDLEKMLPMMLMMQTGAAGTDPAVAGTGMSSMMQMMQMQMMMKMFAGDNNSFSGGKKSPFRG